MKVVFDRCEYVREHNPETGYMVVRKRIHVKLVETNPFRRILNYLKTIGHNDKKVKPR